MSEETTKKSAALDILKNIQQSLKVPKSERNDYAGFNYRNIEGILEAAKKQAAPYGASIVLSDRLVQIGERYYVEATCSLVTPDGTISSTAYAREAEQRKGMDPGQITGACSSYARKYAAQGLFAISGEADLDALPPAAETTWPDGKFNARCGSCGYLGHNFNRQTVQTFPCPKCGQVNWKAA